MKKLLLGSLALLALSAHASVFKCTTGTGVVYSERPCADAAAGGEVRGTQSGERTATAEQHQSDESHVASDKAATMLMLEKQRLAYNEFLSRPNPKAFALCQDGRAIMILAGTAVAVRAELRSLPERCAPYAIDDAVVLAGQ